ncbi:uncharacterized protein BROUX77_007682 [Berkeleyomyces rouxiae]|uniref:uncharacterized protein n=1 Tax=Berkeleyomyces rouxiae TaxID=2035830 RepID=UPI003B7DD8A1
MPHLGQFTPFHQHHISVTPVYFVGPPTFPVPGPSPPFMPCQELPLAAHQTHLHADVNHSQNIYCQEHYSSHYYNNASEPPAQSPPTEPNPNYIAVLASNTEYLILRQVIHIHLPRTAHLPRASTLRPRDILSDSLPSYLPTHLQTGGSELLAQASGFLFAHLEQLNAEGGSSAPATTIAARLHFRLAQTPTVGRTCSSLLALVVALCLLLDEARGFGCSEQLAVDVGGFVADFGAVLRRISRPEDNMMKGLVMASARIFRGGGRAIGLLRRLWDYLEPVERRDVVQAVRAQIGGGTTSSLVRFQQALVGIEGGETGLAGLAS